MSQSFVKGRTDNHLTWVMVDATDFATPESAASAATTIKIYGKLRGAAGVNFVSSGTGSLTNDITHVGASATGIYSIGLVKADLSDASAAWYDQYIITLSCTGCARQTLVVDGGIDASALSAYQSRFSDIQSYLVALSAVISDAHSAAILAASTASEAQSQATLAASRTLALSGAVSDVYSLLSDHHSDFQSRVPKAVATNSQLSDLASDVKSAVTATSSDVKSAVTALSGMVSDVYSLLSDLHSDVTVLSGVVSDSYSLLSDLHSDVGVLSGVVSDAYSLLSDHHSDFQSRVPKAVATNSQVASNFNAAIPDSVPADGTIPSVRQALYMIAQFLMEPSASGTTLTIRKADGTTALFTCTLNDATTPTAVTRST